MMQYNTIFAKSFSRYEQKKLSYGAFLACLFIGLTFFTVLKPSFAHLPALNLQVSMRASLAKLLIESTSNSLRLVPESEEEILPVDNATVQNFEESTQQAEDSESGAEELKEEIKQIYNATVQNLLKSTQHPAEDPIQESEVKNDIKQVINTTSKNVLDSEAQESEAKKDIKQVINTTSKNALESTLQPVAESLVLKSETKQEIKPVCNELEQCEMEGDVRVNGNSSTILFASSTARNESWKIKPYSRKTDKTCMQNVHEFTLKSFASSPKEAPQCTVNHNVPAIVFSVGGYTGNQFHDFSDILVPLFTTAYQFHGEVQFLVTNERAFWMTKYKLIFENLSKYDIIYVDKDEQVRCFPRVIVGLMFHKDFTIDPSKSPNGYAMEDFKSFLRSSYSLKREKAIKLSHTHKQRKPRILIITRKRTRSFTNEGEIIRMARSLGYEVVAAEPGIAGFTKFAEIVNSCDVVMGVHGAGLTNIAFLPTNAVLIQVVPLGRMDWLCKHYFGEPSVDMNIRYLEYKIKEEESTLIQQYPLDHAVFRDPISVSKHGWNAFRAVYLDKQNVKLDVGRFRETLLKALELLHN